MMVKIQLYSFDFFLIFDSLVVQMQFLMHENMSGKVFLYVVIIKL